MVDREPRIRMTNTRLRLREINPSDWIRNTQIQQIYRHEELVSLLVLFSQHTNLPLDLLIEIFCYCLDDYSPVTSIEDTRLFTSTQNANLLYLSLPVMIYPHYFPESITLIVDSKDQGWSSNNPELQGTRQGSYTWGECALSDLPNDRMEIYRNIHAGQAYEHQCIHLTKGIELFDRLIHEYREGLRQLSLLIPTSSSETMPSTIDNLVNPTEETNQTTTTDSTNVFSSIINTVYQSINILLTSTNDSNMNNDNNHHISTANNMISTPSKQQYPILLDIQFYVRSLYPGWIHYLQHAKLEIKYKPNPSIEYDVISRIETMS